MKEGETLKHAYSGAKQPGRVSASLEQVIKELESSPTQEHIWGLIQAFQSGCGSGAVLYVPTLEKEGADLWEVGKLSFQSAKTPDLGANGSVFRKVEMQKGGMAYSAFTSLEEMRKGQDTEYEQLPMEKVLQLALNDDSVLGIVINPWGLSVLLDKKLLGLILKPGQPDTEQSSSIYIEKTSIESLSVDVIVDVETSTLARISSEQSARPAGKDREWLKNRNLTLSRGENIAADYILHLEVPSAEEFLQDEKLLITCIHSALDKAEKQGFKSIAMPAAKPENGTYPLRESLPLLVLAIASWLNEHPEAEMEITLVCPNEEIFKTLNEYLFD